MKPTYLLYLFTLCCVTFVKAQNFEGSIVYDVDFELSDKMIAKGMTKEKITEMLEQDNSFAKNIQYWYKGNNYKLEVTNTGAYSIYVGDKKTLYSQDKTTDRDVIATDVTIDLETRMYGRPPSISVEDTDVTIMNKKCKKVVIGRSNGSYEYYFSPGYLKMNADLYKGFNVNMWYEYLKVAKALPLRIVKKLSDDSITVVMTVSYVEENKVDAKTFELPSMKLDDSMTPYMPENQKLYKKI